MYMKWRKGLGTRGRDGALQILEKEQDSRLKSWAYIGWEGVSEFKYMAAKHL